MLAGEASAGTTAIAGATGFASSPAGAGAAATLTFPNLNPASVNVRFTLPSGWPTKLGITKDCGCAAAVVNKLIFGAATWLAFAGGLCAST